MTTNWIRADRFFFDERQYCSPSLEQDMASQPSTDGSKYVQNVSIALLVITLFVTNFLVAPASVAVDYAIGSFGPAVAGTLLQLMLLAVGVVATKAAAGVIGSLPLLSLLIALWMRLILDLVLRPSGLSVDIQSIRSELWAVFFLGNLLFGASFVLGALGGTAFAVALTVALATYLKLFGASPYQVLAAITGPLTMTVLLVVVAVRRSGASLFGQKTSRPLGHPVVLGLMAFLAMTLGAAVWTQPDRDVALASYASPRSVAPMRSSDLLEPIRTTDGCLFESMASVARASGDVCLFESMASLARASRTDVCLPMSCNEALCFRGREDGAEMVRLRRQAGEFVEQRRVPFELPDRSLRFDPDPGHPPRWTEGGLRVPVYSIGQRTIWGRFPLPYDARYWVNVPWDRNLNLIQMSYGAIRRAVFPSLCLLGLILAVPLALALRGLPKPIASKPGLTIQYRKRVPIWLRGLLFTESDPKRLYLYGEFTEADYRHGDQVKNALTSHLEPPQLRRQGIVRAVGCVAVFAMFAMMFSGL